MIVAIVDYGSGNLHSAAKAFERAGREAGLAADIAVTRDPDLKIPHMGWNTLHPRRAHPLLAGIALGAEGLHGYFVHSYQLSPSYEPDLVADADYGGPVTAVVARDTAVGTQFHPEKSQRLGLALIANFLKWKP